MYTNLIAATFAAMAFAYPANNLAERQAPVCSGTTAQCCATDVLNLVDLDCATRTPSLPSLRTIC